MTEPVVIWRKLTVNFARSVSFPDQVPAVMQVIVVPLSEPSSPAAGVTFVNPIGTQEVVLARSDNAVEFELIPSHLAGLTSELIYRIEWRAGVTGRTFTFDFAMPDQDIRFDELHDLGLFIDGEVYLRQQDLGVPGRVARLNIDGHVVDATGQVLATVGALSSLAGQLQGEVIARQAADAANRAAVENQLETQINSTLATAAANLSNAVAALTATANSDRGARIAADNALGVRIDGVQSDLAALEGVVTGHTAALATKPTLTDGKLDISVIPDAARTQGVNVANQAAMLALTTAQVQQFDFAIRPDGIWALMGTDPSNLAHWVQLNKVLSVNGHVGHAVVTLADVAATAGSIDIDQVDGLEAALASAGDAAAISALEGRVTAIEEDDTIVKLVEGVIPHELNDDRMVYLNEDDEIVDKAGNVLTVPGTGSVNSVNGEDGIVVLDLSSVAAQGGSIDLDQVDGLVSALGDKVGTSDTRLSNARTPTSHAASHAAAGTDPVTLTTAQITGLGAILTNNGLTSSSNHENRIQSLELGGGGGGGGSIAKANWFQGVDDFDAVTDPADFQTEYSVELRGPFSRNDDGTFTYSPGGIAPGGETYVYAYVTPNGHLQLREWDESGPPDPELALADDLNALSLVVSGKAATAALEALELEVADKADQSALEALTGTVSAKADQSTVSALTTTVNSKADASTVSALTSTVNTKASQTDLTTAQNNISALQSGKANLSGGTVPLSELPSYPTSKVTGLDTALTNLTNSVATKANSADVTTALASKADLVGGKIPSSQLPSVALTTVTVVANRAAMLAQTTAQVQPGDVTIISATSDRGNYVLSATDPSVFSNWTKLVSSDGSVTSVNSQTGPDIVLSAADVGARSLSDLLSISDTSGLQAALDLKASTAALTSGLAGKTSPSDVQTTLTNSAMAKQRVLRVATTSVASLSGSQSIDGALVAPGNLVLLTAQPSSVNNGIWQTASGAWTRPADFASGAYLVRGTLVAVEAGTAYANTLWQETAASGVIGTNNNNWAYIGSLAAPFAPVAGNGIAIDGGTTFRVTPTTGIAVSGAGVGIDTGVVPRKVTGTVPSGSTTVTLTHNLGTNSPIVQIIEIGSGNLVAVGATVTGTNTVSVEFGSAPTTNQYRWICIG